MNREVISSTIKPKRNMSKTKILLLMSTSILFMFACKRENTQESSPCRQSKTFYVNLENVYKQNIPYTGKDTLHFIDTAGNTLTFLGQGIDSNFNCMDVAYLPVCPPDNGCYKYYDYKFKEVNDKETLNIKHYKKRTTSSIEGISISFNNLTYSISDIGIGDVNSKFFFPKRVFNSNTFVNVSWSNIINTTDTLFYNPEIGIIALGLKGNLWSINN